MNDFAAPLLELDGLEVRLGGRTVLAGLDGTLSGRVVGLLGPNGAGKTTLLATLLGFHPPHSGTARVLGRDITTDRDRAHEPPRLHARERRLHRRTSPRCASCA